MIRIERGRPELLRGMATAALLDEIRVLCRRHSLEEAEVRGQIRGARISLVFDRRFPADAQQQLRNWWANSGWNCPIGV